MKKSLAAALLSFFISSCFKTDVRQYESWNQDPFTKTSGYQVNRLPKQYNSFSGARFLSKYDDTMWADTENYYSDWISNLKGWNLIILQHDVSYCYKMVYKNGILTFKTNEDMFMV